MNVELQNSDKFANLIRIIIICQKQILVGCFKLDSELIDIVVHKTNNQ